MEPSVSIWQRTAPIPDFGTLASNLVCDVCIVGAGITGISTAYRLVQEGKSVVVLDDRSLAAGETRRTTAHLASAFDDRYFRMEGLHGDGGARLIAESHAAAIDLIEVNVRDLEIDCDFERVDGFLFVPPEDQEEILQLEFEACRRAGLDAVEWVDRAPIEAFDTRRCLRFPRQAQIHPLKYVNSLTRALLDNGGKVYCGAHVDTIEGGRDTHVTVQDGRIVDSEHIVVATNTPVNEVVAIHTKQAAYRSYVIGLRVPPLSVTKALFWDTADPYHYVRLQPRLGEGSSPYDVLIVGGEDHKTGQPAPDCQFEKLENWTRQRFPVAQAVEYRWSGQIMEPVDGVAFIGRNPLEAKNIYICTGDSGQGMTHGTIASVLITDLIMGRQNSWAKLYDPSRVTPRATGEFARQI
jgi:glycine/D-amino acid oxidase-like deaminating enzyme